MIVVLLRRKEIYIDWRKHVFDLPDHLDPNVAVIRWDGQRGQIERDHVSPPEVEAFDDLAVVQPYIDAAASPPEEIRDAAFLAEADRADLIDRLKTATPAQINTWIDNNVTNIATARAVLKALVKVLAIHITR